MADLPLGLAEAVERLLEDVPPRELVRASAELSTRYRDKRERRAPVARSEAEILAYAASRLPATYAAVSAVFEAVREQRPRWTPRSLLDLGAGPGTGLWSAASRWPSIERAVAVEAEPRMVALGQALAQAAAPAPVRGATWVRGTVTDVAPDGPFDLVVMAYVLGELDQTARDRAVDRAAEATSDPGGLAVIVEPGTPEGYARVLRARDRLLARGGFVAAPCPHDDRCPWAGSETDWCHFAARLARTAAHRAAKGGALGYEDEKYAYVAVSRQRTARAGARVVRHPQVRPRLIELELCTPAGIQRRVVTKKERDAFRQARKIDWGDSFDYTAGDATDDADTP
jgi:ribosomal protein RSM22 (predicted rRNA methylase)